MATAAEIAAQVTALVEAGGQTVSIPCAPLMHGTGCWLGWFIPMLGGAHIVTLTNRSLDAHEVLDTIERRRADAITIVGDSFAKPLVRAIDEGKPDGSAYDLSSVRLFDSSGVMWTTEVKNDMIERVPQAILIDAMGSTEGSMGTQITTKGVPVETAKFEQGPNTKVFTDDDREVVPGSDEVGKVAAGGNVPLGYYKDPDKSARTFRVIDGVRYSFPGDLAMVAEDGTLILLGRGSQVINTGGEKVFPEEVEEAVKRVDGVLDCLVVGVENEKFGQAVTAVASLVDGATVDEATIIAAVKHDLAGYKAPKSVIFVDHVPRAPNGKADYKTARILADVTAAARAACRRRSRARAARSHRHAARSARSGRSSSRSGSSIAMNASPSFSRRVANRSPTKLSSVKRSPSTWHPCWARSITATSSSGDRLRSAPRCLPTGNGIDGCDSTGAIIRSSTIIPSAKPPEKHMPTAPTPGPPTSACTFRASARSQAITGDVLFIAIVVNSLAMQILTIDGEA